MKKFAVLFAFFVFIADTVFTDTTSVKLVTNFRLNPITGINGDALEASSKFVQRMIFSPLVFPLQDPYLEDNYEVALDLSIIEEVIYWQDSRGNWQPYDLRSGASEAMPSSRFFKIKVRDNIFFFQYDTKERRTSRYSELYTEDVVYSYRLFRITIDRAYDDYTKNSKRTGQSLNLNTLLYSKVKSFNDIYCSDDNNGIIFEMDSDKTCIAFQNLLVYVPILSMEQLIKENAKWKNAQTVPLLHSSLNFPSLASGNRLLDKSLDNFDFNHLLTYSRAPGLFGKRLLDDFYDHPIGYGQFLVRTTEAKDDKMNDEFTKIQLIRNPDWCSFGNVEKKVGGDVFVHTNYSANRDELLIRMADQKTDIERIQDLVQNPAEVLYNIPLSARSFMTNEGAQANILTEGLSKRKMQISHHLYGMFFGPSIRGGQTIMAMNPELRSFFATFADRVRMENIIKFIMGQPDLPAFISSMMETKSWILTSDINVHRLYYPFYLGVTEDAANVNTRIGNYYKTRENADPITMRYLLEGGGPNPADYFISLDNLGREDFYHNFVKLRGIDFFGDFPSEVATLCQTKFDSPLVKNNLLVNNRVQIVIYYEKADRIGEIIASCYKNVLESFFSAQAKNGKMNFDPSNISFQQLGEYPGDWKRNAEANARRNTISLLVRGWNYKFDLLDELKNQYIDDLSKAFVENQYIGLISPRAGVRENAESIAASIAEYFYNYSIIVSLVGVQNYVLYHTQRFPSFEKHHQIQMMLLPYYWKGNGE
jgi:hypothetical protein